MEQIEEKICFETWAGEATFTSHMGAFFEISRKKSSMAYWMKWHHLFQKIPNYHIIRNI